MIPEIKICGITRPEDAECAIEAGADYLGLIFAPQSPRLISQTMAQAILDTIRQRVPVVVVFQDQPLTIVKDFATQLDLDFIQLHGSESPDYCQQVPRPVVKRIPVTKISDEKTLQIYAPSVSSNIYTWLVEPPKSDTRFDWTAISLAPLREASTRFWLAGRLTVESVAAMIHQHHPFGVDVASGVESQPGIKDPEKLKRFCQSVQTLSTQKDASSCNR